MRQKAVLALRTTSIAGKMSWSAHFAHSRYRYSSRAESGIRSIFRCCGDEE